MSLFCSSRLHIQWWPKWLENECFHQLKNGFKSVISMFCCSVSVGNISFHFQTFILPLIVIIQWYFCLTTASAPHRDLIWSSSVCLEWHEETEQTETKSRRTVATSPRRFKKPSCKAPWKKLCASAPRAKAALNARMLTPNVDLI